MDTENGRGRRERQRGWRDCGRVQWNQAACESRSQRRGFSFLEARFQRFPREIALIACDDQRRAEPERVFPCSEDQQAAFEGALYYLVAKLRRLLASASVAHQLDADH